jgi:hypothetical protein
VHPVTRRGGAAGTARSHRRGARRRQASTSRGTGPFSLSAERRETRVSGFPPFEPHRHRDCPGHKRPRHLPPTAASVSGPRAREPCVSPRDPGGLAPPLRCCC